MSGEVRGSNPNDAMAVEGVPAAGTIIEGKYEVERLLGVGGMGVVVAARHVQLGQRVAIKFMRGIAAEDANAVGRFLREARSAVSLSSEHVAKVVDVGTLPDGAPFIVMEYLSGVDLGELVRQYGPMSVPDAVNAILQVCEAIAEAHSLGIIHRDLKPANLFVTRRVDGSPLVKVLDFGISKRSDFDAALGRSTLTPSGYLMGSPAYMSPEQVRNPKAVDARTDVWALGVILYEVITGTAPFAGETVGETLA
ncbi:MAG TPA: serine/threonine-protein kinase, partial [Polyangiaceae bacterium]